MSQIQRSSSSRNRSEGWKHAKLDGHENERSFGRDLLQDPRALSEIQEYVFKEAPEGPPTIEVDGTKHVASIFEDSTTSKVDVSLTWSGGEKIGVSLKKSSSGQVWLVTVPRFVSAIEYYLGRQLDPEIHKGISLFVGGSNMSSYESEFKRILHLETKRAPKLAIQEKRHSRLMAESLKIHNPNLWQSLLGFFTQNIGLITRLSFSQGLAKFEEDFADVVVYNQAHLGVSVYAIESLVSQTTQIIIDRPVTPGPRNGGSTLLLPTGFVQMHRPQGDNQLQFHHQFKKIAKLWD
jgi:hypothetical protein